MNEGNPDLSAVLDAPECAKMLRGLQVVVGSMFLGMAGFAAVVTLLPFTPVGAFPFPGFLMFFGALHTRSTGLLKELEHFLVRRCWLRLV